MIPQRVTEEQLRRKSEGQTHSDQRRKNSTLRITRLLSNHRVRESRRDTAFSGPQFCEPKFFRFLIQLVKKVGVTRIKAVGRCCALPPPPEALVAWLPSPSRRSHGLALFVLKEHSLAGTSSRTCLSSLARPTLCGGLREFRHDRVASTLSGQT